MISSNTNHCSEIWLETPENPNNFKVGDIVIVNSGFLKGKICIIERIGPWDIGFNGVSSQTGGYGVATFSIFSHLTKLHKVLYDT